MANFVRIVNLVVTDSIVISDDVVGNKFPASEVIGKEFIRDHNYDGTWLQTSLEGKFRKQYASIGFTYDPIKDKFIAPQPYPSWSLDTNNDWQPPVAEPLVSYYWDEETQSWINIYEPSTDSAD